MVVESNSPSRYAFSIPVSMRWVMLPLLLIACVSLTSAQDSDADVKPAASESEADADSKAKADQDDAFAVPKDASAEELFDFILNIKKNSGRTLESVSRSAAAAVEAAQAICQIDGLEIEDETRAIQEQLAALSFLSQREPERKKQLEVLIEELKSDERAEIAKIGTMEALKFKIIGVGRASQQEQSEVLAEYKAALGDGEFDRSAFSLGMTLAGAVENPDSPEMAATFYEFLAGKMEQSDDIALQERSESLRGAARRIRLPGNFMELKGKTTDGEDFDWESYRGKVVLVNFWASWCGPCRAEIPNMKRNLEDYAERGFAIVGINLDRTLEACNEYVEKEQIQWQNIIGEQGEDNPIVTFYGISAIPTAILVDREGKVVSLRARGKELDRLLAEMLGDPKAEQDESDKDAEPDAEPGDA